MNVSRIAPKYFMMPSNTVFTPFRDASGLIAVNATNAKTITQLTIISGVLYFFLWFKLLFSIFFSHQKIQHSDNEQISMCFGNLRNGIQILSAIRHGYFLKPYLPICFLKFSTLGILMSSSSAILIFAAIPYDECGVIMICPMSRDSLISFIL